MNGQRDAASFPDLAQAPTDENLDPEYLRLFDEPSEGVLEGVGDMAREVAIGAAQGAARTGLPLTLGYLGAKAGLATGPYAPVAAPVLALLGLGSGAFFGKQTEKFLPSARPEEESPLRAGGRMFSESMSFSPLAFFLPRVTAGRVASILSNLGESARKAPGAYLSAETIMSMGAGVGAGVAQELSPGDPLAQGIGGAAGGISFSLPATIVQTAIASTGPSLLKSLNPVSWGTNFSAQKEATIAALRQRQNQRAVDKFLTVLEQNKEDLPSLIRALESAGPPGVPAMTASQKTGNRTLARMEARLALGSPIYKAETLEQGELAFDALRALLYRMNETGDPSLLVAAAKTRENAFNQILQNRLFAAEAQAASRIAAIPKDNAASRAQIGQIVKGQVEDALLDARTHEKFLWDRAIKEMSKPDSREVTRLVPSRLVDAEGKPFLSPVTETVVGMPSTAPQNTVDDFLEYTLSLGDAVYDRTTPALVKDIMARFGVTDDVVRSYKGGRRTPEFMETGKIPSSFVPNARPIELSELVNYRSNLLKLTREALGRGDVNDAHFYSMLSSSLLKDIDALDNPILSEARAFSKAVNDAFTRTYANDLTSVNTRGAARVSPEMLVHRAFGSNVDATAQRMFELSDAVRFPRTAYEDALARLGPDNEITQALRPVAESVDQNLTTLDNAFRSVVLTAAARSLEGTMDPQTGQITRQLNPVKLSEFVTENRALLSHLGLVDTLTDAVKAQNALDLVVGQNSAINKNLRNQTAFSRVLAGGENPVNAISDALKSRHSARDFAKLAKLAQASGGDAADGLKSAVYDYLYMAAGGDRGFSPAEYQKLLFTPLASGQPSVVKILRDSNILSLTEVKGLKRILDPMMRIERGLERTPPLEGFITGASAVEELGMRLIGSGLGVKAFKASPLGGESGASLIAASAGSKYIRQQFDALPTLELRRVIEKASQDPAFLAELLKQGKTQREAFSLAKKLRGFMLSSGIATSLPEPEEPEDPFFPSSTPRSRSMLRQLPPTAGTRGIPGLQLAAAPGQPGGAPGGGPGGGGQNSRAMLQSLFPFDATLAGMPLQTPPGAPPTGP